MTIPPTATTLAAPTKPVSLQTTAKSQVAAPKDADGDTDGSTAAQAAAEKKGGVDVKG